MTLLATVAAWSLLGFGLLLFALQLGAHELGYQSGRWWAARRETPSDSVGVVVGGMLGLLAFVLALTLSFANSSFSERRAETLAEANAIGTAWLRANAIGHPRGGEIARLLEQYTHLRIDFIRAESGSPEIDDLNRRTNALQTEIWGHASAIVRERTDPVAASLMAALNDTFDMTTATRFAATGLAAARHGADKHGRSRLSDGPQAQSEPRTGRAAHPDVDRGDRRHPRSGDPADRCTPDEHRRL